MDVREKLVELIDTNCGYVDKVKAEVLADHLIANGVTVAYNLSPTEPLTNCQKWIPVTERLPEVGSRVIACGEKGGVFVVKSEGITTAFGRMDGSSKYRSFTHWMPLPEPPKGEV